MKYSVNLKLIPEAGTEAILKEASERVSSLAKWTIRHATSKVYLRGYGKAETIYHEAAEKHIDVGRRLLLLTLDDVFSNLRSLGAIKIAKKGWPVRLDEDNSRFLLEGKNVWLEAQLQGRGKERTKVLLDVDAEVPSKYYAPFIDAVKKGETPPCKIVYRRGCFWLHATLDRPIESWEGELCYGIDLNKRNVVVVGVNKDGKPKLVKFFNTKPLLHELNLLDVEYSGLQRSKQWKLARENRRRYRYAIKAWCATLTGELNKLFEKHPPKLVAIENLRNLKGRQDWQNRKWARRLIREAIHATGAYVEEVSSAYTSSTCYRCGERIIRSSRKEENGGGWQAYCPVCNKTIHADLNAAINIAFRGMGSCRSRPMIDTSPAISEPCPAISQGTGSKCQGPSQPGQVARSQMPRLAHASMGVNEGACAAPEKRRSRELNAKVASLGGEGENKEGLQQQKDAN